MPRQTPEDFPWQDYAMQIPSPCGRVFAIPMEKIRQDYVGFRMSQDGFSSADEAMVGVDVSDVRSWFMNQFTWDDVDRLGVCEREASDQDIQEALDIVRRRQNPQANAQIKERPDWASGRASQKMDQDLPRAPARPKGPSGRL